MVVFRSLHVLNGECGVVLRMLVHLAQGHHGELASCLALQQAKEQQVLQPLHRGHRLLGLLRLGGRLFEEHDRRERR